MLINCRHQPKREPACKVQGSLFARCGWLHRPLLAIRRVSGTDSFSLQLCEGCRILQSYVHMWKSFSSRFPLVCLHVRIYHPGTSAICRCFHTPELFLFGTIRSSTHLSKSASSSPLYEFSINRVFLRPAAWCPNTVYWSPQSSLLPSDRTLVTITSNYHASKTNQKWHLLQCLPYSKMRRHPPPRHHQY